MTILSFGVFAAEDHDKQRQEMVLAIEDTVRYTSEHIGKDSLDAAVMNVMARVPRHKFIPDEIHSYAYVNSAMPIGHDQTISQPYIVALMTDLAEVNADSVVLEVGTGSGYQAAILAELVKSVYTIEIIRPLADQAREVLDKLGYRNIHFRIGDGFHGWPEASPFDAILVTAAIDKPPQDLIRQLKTGGRLVLPLGLPQQTQILTVIEKQADGSVIEKGILPVGFVPLTGDH